MFFCRLLWASFVFSRVFAPPGPGGSCFSSKCEHHDALQHCLSGEWTCHSDQFCDLHIHSDTIDMRCRHKGGRDLDDCHHHQSHNEASCSQHPPHGDCHYCCSDHHCLDSLLEPVTTHPVTTQPVTTHHPLTTHTPRPGSASCFSTHCDIHSDLEACTLGQWVCGADEYCRLDTSYLGSIHMQCAPLTDLAHCEVYEAHNSQLCYPLTHSRSRHCRYCCHDATCIQSIAGLITTTTTPTSFVTTPTHDVVTHYVPRPGPNSCFTTGCDGHGSLDACTSGQWACSDDEYCTVELSSHGTVHMDCDPLHILSHCQLIVSHQNPPSCSTSTFLTESNCRFCCHDADCVHKIGSGINTTIVTSQPSTTITTTATPSTTTPTTTPTTKTSTATPTTTTSTTPTTTTTFRTSVIMNAETTMSESTGVATTPTSTSTRIMTTTAPMTTTSAAGIMCTICNNLECLLNPNVTLCPQGHISCITTITDTHSGRQIFRGCAEETTCHDTVRTQHPECGTVEDQYLSDGTVCRFCCKGDNCNRPPHLLPDVTTLIGKK